jgi:hypothetical protein
MLRSFGRNLKPEYPVLCDHSRHVPNEYAIRCADRSWIAGKPEVVLNYCQQGKALTEPHSGTRGSISNEKRGSLQQSSVLKRLLGIADQLV